MPVSKRTGKRAGNQLSNQPPARYSSNNKATSRQANQAQLVGKQAKKSKQVRGGNEILICCLPWPFGHRELAVPFETGRWGGGGGCRRKGGRRAREANIPKPSSLLRRRQKPSGVGNVCLRSDEQRRLFSCCYGHGKEFQHLSAFKRPQG